MSDKPVASAAPTCMRPLFLPVVVGSSCGAGLSHYFPFSLLIRQSTLCMADESLQVARRGDTKKERESWPHHDWVCPKFAGRLILNCL